MARPSDAERTLVGEQVLAAWKAFRRSPDGLGSANRDPLLPAPERIGKKASKTIWERSAVMGVVARLFCFETNGRSESIKAYAKLRYWIMFAMFVLSGLMHNPLGGFMHDESNIIRGDSRYYQG